MVRFISLTNKKSSKIVFYQSKRTQRNDPTEWSSRKCVKNSYLMSDNVGCINFNRMDFELKQCIVCDSRLHQTHREHFCVSNQSEQFSFQNLIMIWLEVGLFELKVRAIHISILNKSVYVCNVEQLHRIEYIRLFAMN